MPKEMERYDKHKPYLFYLNITIFIFNEILLWISVFLVMFLQKKKTQICIAKYKVIVSSNKSYIHHHTLDTGDCDLKNVNVIFYLVVQLALCNSYIIHTWHYVIHLIVKIKIPNIRSSLRSITCFIKAERCSLIYKLFT